MNYLHPISNELLLCRWNNGIKLIDPDLKQLEFNVLSQQSITQLHEMPFNVYFNSGGIIRYANESTIKMCGFDSSRAAIGKTVVSVAKKETFLFEQAHDKQVIERKRMIVMQENFQRQDGLNTLYVSLKFPWYNSENKIIGIFGCSLPIRFEDNYFSNALSLMIQTGLFNSFDMLQQAQYNRLNDLFSKREKEILQLLVRGKTAKETSVILALSKRTIEHYIENIKLKFDVSKKSALIEKAINYLNFN